MDAHFARAPSQMECQLVMLNKQHYTEAHKKARVYVLFMFSLLKERRLLLKSDLCTNYELLLYPFLYRAVLMYLFLYWPPNIDLLSLR